MHYYRLTKYNPRFRDAQGRYKKDEWTYYEQIGQNFAAGTFTKAEYLATEKRYIECICELLRTSNVLTMRSERVARRKEVTTFNGVLLRKGKSYTLDELRKIIPGVLRGRFWMQFRTDEGYFLHFDWDYYVYLGLPLRRNQLVPLADKFNLFLEESHMPDLEEGR